MATARIVKRLSGRLSGLPRQSVAWLLLAPEWPEELLDLGFPWEPAEQSDKQPEDLADGPVAMLRRASQAPSPDAAGEASSEKRPRRIPRPIVIESNALSPWEGSTYRIAPELRSAGLQELLHEPEAADGPAPETGLNFIREQLVLAAGVMLRSDKLPDYPTLRRWAQLASQAASDDAMGATVDAEVRMAIAAAVSNQEASAPVALRWIEAAEFFADILQGKLELALTLARRRRELFLRRAYDRRKLANYIEREDQMAAFKELLKDKDHWALHYVGEGGLGKTMLLRHIQRVAEDAADPEIAIVTSRIDFDFLNPDYPFKAPGLLLSALAEELRLQAGDESTSLFFSFESCVADLNAKATAGNAGMRLVPLEDVSFQQTIGTFASICQVLGYDPRTGGLRCVVFMLDTCEELAKLRPDGTVPEECPRHLRGTRPGPKHGG